VAADIFVSKFDSSLESLEFSTYLGGGGNDVGPQIALDNSGTIHLAGTTMGFPIGLTNNGLYFQASGVADDFPTLHAAQAQFGGGFFLVPNDPAVRSLADGTILLGSRDFFSSHTNDLPADGFVLAIDQPGALKGTLADLSGDPGFSEFYTEEDRKSGLPARALATADKEGKFESEGWRVRKDGTKFWASRRHGGVAACDTWCLRRDN
jgi:hypothetical protein